MFALLCTVACAMVFSGVSARAAIIHEYLSQIAGVPSGSGAPLPGPFVLPRAMTVDGGELYVADGEGPEYRLDKFDASSGAFVSQFPQAPSSLAFLHQGVAVGHVIGEGEVYVTGDEVVPGERSKGVVAVFDRAGVLQGVWKGADTPSGAFGCFECGGAAGVAVDESGAVGDWASGDVYVADSEHGVVDVFEPVAGGGEKYVGQITGPEPPSTLFGGTYAVAVDQSNGDVLIADSEGRISSGLVVDVFRPGVLLGQYEFVVKVSGTPEGPFGGVAGIATDAATDNVFVGDFGGVVDEFGPSGVFLGRIAVGSFGSVRSVAVDPVTHRLFVGSGSVVDVFGPDLAIPDVTTDPATNVEPESATLNGTVNPVKAGQATCQFEYGTSTSFGQVVSCSSPVPDGESPVPVQAAITGLRPDTTYYYRLQASNANGTNPGEVSQDREFITPGPGIREESVSNVASTSTTLEATIDPHGAPTTYYFQFGTSTAYGSDVPAAPGTAIGSGEGGVEVSQHVQEGLTAATTYHYRVVAVSEVQAGRVEAFAGPDETFTTQVAAGGGVVLSDGRAWEMVTPPDKHGAQFSSIFGTALVQAAAAGGALTWVADDPTEPMPQGYTNLLQGFSARGAGGWVSRDIAIAHPGATGLSIGQGEEYRFFSEDLSGAVVQPFGGFVPSLSVEASEPTAYLSTEYRDGDPVSRCSTSCFRPLVTGAPGFANVPAGTVFGEEGAEGKCIFDEIYCGPRFVGATPDLSHVVLQSSVALTSVPAPHGGLYEWSGGKLVLVSVLPGPGGEAATNPVLGFENAAGGQIARHAISGDGSRVFWTEKATGNLFVRDVARNETLLISEKVEFEDANADGSIVFFSGHMCEIRQNVSTGDLECPVVGLGASVVGASEDGSWVYFISTSVLAPGGVPGGNNIYVRHDGVTRFIASVPEEDARRANKVGGLTGQTARVSPDGRWLAFMSHSELTGDRTRDAVNGRPDEEVYLYDAEANGGKGRLVCASCNPSGARPVGTEYTGNPGNHMLWGGGRVWENDTMLASNIPGWTPYKELVALHQSRYLSDSGRLFFNSKDGLVPQDVNGMWDVYEYEPPGVGSCGTASVTFSVRSDGCVGLVSSGDSGEESGFIDASETGGDVFFLTSAKLAGQDYDTALDVYDAHECSSSVPCFAPAPVKPPVCDTGDACKAAPTPQPAVFGSPSSATFTGAGNVVSAASKSGVSPKGLTRAQKLARALRACRKKKGKRRASCVRQAKARYASRARRVTASKRGRG